MPKYQSLFNEGQTIDDSSGALAEEFGIPPFSVLDARSGQWQARKAAWLALGIEGTVGRGENLLKFSDTVLQPDGDGRRQTGTSCFDPVICELFYRWFVLAGGNVVDPFCGGPTASIVANHLGYKFTGFDVRQEQLDANAEQCSRICKKEYQLPKFIYSDALDIRKHCKQESLDGLWSCPPYVDLEKYSNHERDISRLKWTDFEPVYASIMKQLFLCLKPDRFMGLVVGEVRGKDGNCVGFVPGTIRACEDAGFRLYNDAILLTAVGSLSIRTGRQFRMSRKFGRTHQHLLIFLKGNSKKAVAAIEESHKDD